MRNLEFVNGEFYHLFNRGTDKREIFLVDADYERFLQSLHLFNNAIYSAPRNPFQRIEALSMSERYDFEREHFVDIFAFTLLPNHFHLLVRQLKDGGISRLMHKLEMGFSKYLNNRIDRVGTLYEGEYKAVHVSKESHLVHLPIYIHLNILDLTPFCWREGKIEDWQTAVQFMDSYRWSSHRAYKGAKQYLPIIREDVREEIYPNVQDYMDHLKGWSSRYLLDHLAKFS